MIAQIKGEIVDKFEGSVIIDVNGLGYEVLVSEPDYEKLMLNETVKLHTYFAVRENAQELYGFSEPAAKRLFDMLLDVNGVGPKVALSILSLGEPKQTKNAIASKNIAYIQSAGGVGKKGAEKVILELKDKVGPMGDESSLLDEIDSDDDAQSALISLGYSANQAAQALAGVDGDLKTEERVKMALKELSQ